MKLPEDMTIGQRIVLTFVIVLVILFALALFGWSTGRWDEAPAAEPDLYGYLPLDEHLLRQDRRALDDAYNDHVVKLFIVWLTQGAEKDASQFRNGLRITRRAYNQAAQGILKREQEILHKETPK